MASPPRHRGDGSQGAEGAAGHTVWNWSTPRGGSGAASRLKWLPIKYKIDIAFGWHVRMQNPCVDELCKNQDPPLQNPRQSLTQEDARTKQISKQPKEVANLEAKSVPRTWNASLAKRSIIKTWRRAQSELRCHALRFYGRLITPIQPIRLAEGA